MLFAFLLNLLAYRLVGGDENGTSTAATLCAAQLGTRPSSCSQELQERRLGCRVFHLDALTVDKESQRIQRHFSVSWGCFSFQGEQ